MTDTLQEAPTAVRPINHWIGGMAVSGDSGRSGARLQPGDGQADGRGRLRITEEVDRAVAAAKAAFPAWRATSLSKRADLFFRIRATFDAHRDNIARLLTSEHGKVHADALGEVARGLEIVEFACGSRTC